MGATVRKNKEGEKNPKKGGGRGCWGGRCISRIFKGGGMNEPLFPAPKVKKKLWTHWAEWGKRVGKKGEACSRRTSVIRGDKT